MIDHSTSLSLSSTSSSLSASFTTSPSTANGGIIISVFPILCGVLIITTLALMNVAVICLRRKERSHFIIHRKKAINKLHEDNQQLINDRDEANQKQEDIVLRQNCAYEHHDHSASNQQIRAGAELNHHQDDTIVLQRNSAYEQHDHSASKRVSVGAELNQRQDDAIVLQQNRAYELHDLRATHQQERASDDEPYLVILETAGQEEPHKKCTTENKQSEDGGSQSASIELQCHHADSAKSYDDEDYI